MKKIMFNDRFGLTEAVLQGRKTMTRRIVPPSTINFYDALKKDGATLQTFHDFVLDHSNYLNFDTVAVAQCYRDILEVDQNACIINCKRHKGYKNKMFVRANDMPHQIRITNIRIERLQDISDEDCRREGIVMTGVDGRLSFTYYDEKRDLTFIYPTPPEAFATLIDKVSGKGTWERNPWVFVYEFELVK